MTWGKSIIWPVHISVAENQNFFKGYYIKTNPFSCCFREGRNYWQERQQNHKCRKYHQNHYVFRLWSAESFRACRWRAEVKPRFHIGGVKWLIPRGTRQFTLLVPSRWWFVTLFWCVSHLSWNLSSLCMGRSSPQECKLVVHGQIY